MTAMDPTRRAVLLGGGTAAATSLAGCMNFLGLDSDSDADGYAAFEAIHDFAEQVGGDELSFENPVGTGRMGHGWNPPADLTPDIARTDVFVYLDTPEFSWAQDIASTLERDHDDEVTVIDLLDGLDAFMIPFDYDPDVQEQMPGPTPGHSPSVADVHFDEFDIWDLRAQDQLGYWHVDHWHGGIPEVPLDGHVPVGIVLRDVDDAVIPLGEEESYRVDARVVDGPAEALTITVEDNVVEFHGQETGEVTVAFEFYHEGDLVYETTDGPTTVTVLEEPDGDSDEFHDPHTWVDPVIVQEMVDRLADEFAAMDPDNEEIYRDNAEAYTDRVADVHEQFQALTASADHDVAVFAGHDSFQYLERRYGFKLETPTGISPDADASFDDIADLVATIEDNDIDVVLYDPFEAPQDEYPQIVESIFDHTDVEEAKPLTPVEGTTEEWADAGWGWVEQMEEINLPNLAAALDAE